MTRARPANLAFLVDYFAAMEAKDLDRLASYYAEDMTLRFAGAPEVRGRDDVLAQMRATLASVESLAHPLINVWEEDDGLVILEVTSVWRFPDGAEHHIDACSLFTLRDGQFTDQRIYVDNSPIAHYLA